MKRFNFILLIFLGLFFACDSSSENEDAQFLALYDGNDGNPSYGFFSPNEFDGVGNGIKQTEEQFNPSSRKFIKNGQVTFETPDLEKTKKRIEELIKKHQGYISKDSENELDNRINVHLTIRVPAKNFDSLLSDISTGVEKFDYKQVKIKDVTEEFLDVTSRLKNKKELEKRYLEILQKAKNVKEILEVEREIGKLREDIESAEGRLKFLQDQIALSTLEVSFYKEVYYESSFGKKTKEALKDGFSGLKSFFLGLLSVWPFLIIGILMFIWLRRRIKRKKKS
jgi:hypothetical protein